MTRELQRPGHARSRHGASPLPESWNPDHAQSHGAPTEPRSPDHARSHGAHGATEPWPRPEPRSGTTAVTTPHTSRRLHPALTTSLLQGLPQRPRTPSAVTRSVCASVPTRPVPVPDGRGHSPGRRGTQGLLALALGSHCQQAPP